MYDIIVFKKNTFNAAFCLIYTSAEYKYLYSSVYLQVKFFL